MVECFGGSCLRGGFGVLVLKGIERSRKFAPRNLRSINILTSVSIKVE